ncbi:hypothetical protein PAL15_002399 [Salmonella enterica]|nr:hypothetical protein [Salmonella enterica]
MSGINQISFTEVLKQPPHKDISRTNKYIVSQGFSCGPDLLINFLSRLGYSFSPQLAKTYISSLKKQFDEFCEKRKDESDIEYFYDVGGTPFYSELIAFCLSDDFYNKAVKFNPELNFSGELSGLKKRVFRALKEKEFRNIGSGVLYLTSAVDMALKKIGVNPYDEINNLSKSQIVAMSMMNDIGGMQFYLPKGRELECVINRVDIYIDSLRMDYRDVAIKYGISNKSVFTLAERVRTAIKEYEDE